jgi:thiamine-phosphate pyrophosphorylase
MFESGVYLIWDLPLAGAVDPDQFMIACGGHLPVAVQLRAKAAERQPEVLDLLLAACERHGMPLFINDRSEWWQPGCAGIHLGQDDGPAPTGFGSIGRSTHDLEQVVAANDERAVDHLGFGPVAATQSKVGALPARGFESLHAACRLSRKPVVAIGGLGADSVLPVRRAGAHAMAVIGAVFGAPNPAAACAELVRCWAAHE